MFGHRVNPASVRPGDKIATKFQELADGTIRIIKTRDVKSVSTCNKAENFHLDHECHDTRFSTIIVPLPA